MTEPHITVDEWRAALEAMHKDASGFLAREFVKVTGRSYSVARRRLTDLIEAGVVVCTGKRSVVKCDGAAMPKPVYQFVKRIKTSSKVKGKRQ